MRLLIDSFWRAMAYCFMPRIIALTILPLIIVGAASVALAYFFAQPAVDAIRFFLEGYNFYDTLNNWLAGLGLGSMRHVVPHLVLIMLATPVMIILTMGIVAFMLTPASVALVSMRRFPALERKGKGGLLSSIFWSLGALIVALFALGITSPLWVVIAPLSLLIPPLIWGWLTWRIFAYDALQVHASRAERKALFAQHRAWLLVIGVVAGYLGAAPTLLWASGALIAAFFVVLVPLALWMYTVIFAFASLWFTHYCLAALDEMRHEQTATPAWPASPPSLTPPLTPLAPSALGTAHPPASACE